MILAVQRAGWQLDLKYRNGPEDFGLIGSYYGCGQYPGTWTVCD